MSRPTYCSFFLLKSPVKIGPDEHGVNWLQKLSEMHKIRKGSHWYLEKSEIRHVLLESRISTRIMALERELSSRHRLMVFENASKRWAQNIFSQQPTERDIIREWIAKETSKNRTTHIMILHKRPVKLERGQLSYNPLKVGRQRSRTNPINLSRPRREEPRRTPNKALKNPGDSWVVVNINWVSSPKKEKMDDSWFLSSRCMSWLYVAFSAHLCHGRAFVV